MTRLKRFYPELGTLLLNLAVLRYWISPVLMIFIIFLITFISSCLYRAAGRPHMWTHLLVQPIPVAIYGIFWDSGVEIILVVLMSLFMAVFATPVCAVYQLRQSRRRLSENPEQGSENE